ncbi:MAG: hypothetical protein ACR2IN_05450 [Thermoleophilaceae bacterium]
MHRSVDADQETPGAMTQARIENFGARRRELPAQFAEALALGER